MKIIERKSLLLRGLLLVLMPSLLAGCVIGGVKSSIHIATIESLPDPTPTKSEVDLLLTQKCLSTTLLTEHKSGSIVYSYGGWQTAILDLSNGMDYPLGETFPIMAVSPDYQYLAYTTEDPATLRIVTSFGDTVQTVSIPEDWMGVIQWVDDEQILIERFLDGPYFQASSILYNIKTGLYQEYLPDYPDYQYFLHPAEDLGNYSYSRLIFNPQFTRIVYPQQIVSAEFLMLMDTADRQPILQIRGFISAGAPQWAKDGSFFITNLYTDAVNYEQTADDWPYAGGTDLYRIGQDGDIKRLTYFSNQYHGAFIFLPSLSPDDRYVAFLLSLSDDPANPLFDPKLSILDIETGMVTNLCLHSSYFQPPIWSSDGEIIIAGAADESGSAISIVLVDWKKGFMSSIIWGDGYACGWMEH